jgi:cephalosporin-C deacetylase
MKFKFSFLFFSAILANACLAQQIVVTPGKASAIYDIGEKVTWRVEVTGDKAATVKSADYVLKRSGLSVIKKDTLDLSNGSGTIEVSLSEPGTILGDITTTIDGKKHHNVIGAAIAPDKIQPVSPRPADFDEFWAAKIKQLAEIPANPKLEPADAGNAKVEYFKIQMDNINGSHVYGQLAKPKGEGKFPAVLILQWAGVYNLPKSRVIDQAKHGWLALNIMPHDLPFDQPDAYYKKLANTTLKNYWTIGAEDRDTTYFLRMYLSCIRAADYLTGRPDWDGKTFVVMGNSQGGQQTIMLAGLYPKVTAMMAMVPSSCDVTGPKAGRAIGYPNWADQAHEKKNEKILETARYYDPVNFASGIKCPALIAPGLLDETSPPTGVLAAFNQITSTKQLLLLVNSNHQGDHNAQAPFNTLSEQWLAAIIKGNSVPLK